MTDETLEVGTDASRTSRASRRRLLAAGAGGLALLAGCSGPGTGEGGEEGGEGGGGEEGGEGEGEEGDEGEGEEGDEGEDDLSAGAERRDVNPARGPAGR